MSEIKNFIYFDEDIYREKEIKIDVSGHDNWKVISTDSISHDLFGLNPVQKMNVKRKSTKRLKEIGKNGKLVCSTMLPISGAGFKNIIVTQNCILLYNDYSLVNSLINPEDLMNLKYQESICRKNLCSANDYTEKEKELVTVANTYYKLITKDSGIDSNYIDILVYLNHLLTSSRNSLYTESEQIVKELNKNIR